MLIDWFTVGAQALNFLILVWLMKRFLYQPILDAIDAREERIKAELADADLKKAEALAERDAFQRKSAAFDEQRAALLAQATTEATTEHERLIHAARAAAAALTAKRQQALRSEADNLGQALRRRTRQEVFSIARRALADLAGVTLEERLVDVFVHRLRGLDDAAQSRLAAALADPREPAVVRSAFDLPAAQRAAIQQALGEIFSTDATVRFETAPDLIGGIELSANGQSVAWSITDYLGSMEQGVAELLDAPVAAEPRAGADRPSAAAGS
ncbi:MAG: F0F1 ATP synthase subunit delta [Burkholderiaceae bacterium]